MSYKRAVSAVVTGHVIAKASGDNITSGVTTQVSKDNGAWAATTNGAAHRGDGSWNVTLTATEMDADLVEVKFDNGSTAKTEVTSIATDVKLVSDLNDFAPSSDTVANVGTVAVNTDMRGTDNALLASSAPANFSALLINASGHVSRVTLCDTTTTNSDMRGTDGVDTAPMRGTDGAAVAGDAMTLTAAGVDLIWDEAQAGHTGVGTFGFNLDVPVSTVSGGGGGANRASAEGPASMDIPDTGTVTYRIYVLVYDTNGVSVNADSTPLISVQNAVGTDRSANFNGTVQNPQVGVYYQDYDVADTHAVEQLLYLWTVVQAGDTILAPWVSFVSDTAQSVFDANVVAWRGVQPNSLVGGDVPASVENIDPAVEAALTSATATAVLDEPIAEPTGIFGWAASLRGIVGWIGVLSRNKTTSNATTIAVRNDADSADLATYGQSDDTVTYIKNEGV